MFAHSRVFSCRYLDGREDINGEKTSGLHDTWLMQHGSSNPGFTFNTLEDNLTKRVNIYCYAFHKILSQLTEQTPVLLL